MESVLFQIPHEGPQCHSTLPDFKAQKMMSLSPTNPALQTSGQHSSNDYGLKAKQQCESGLRRSDSGNLQNLPKLRHMFRLLQHWLARRLAPTAPTASQSVHSCFPSSAHPPGMTLLSELATAGQRHQLHRWSSPLQTDAHDHVPQEDPISYSPSDAPVYPHLTDFRGNPALATHVFQAAGADDGNCDDCLGNAATLHDFNVWAQRHSAGTPDSENGWAYWQRLMVLSRRTCHARLPRTFFSCGKSCWTELSATLCWRPSRLHWFPMSQLSLDFGMALALLCLALHLVLSTGKRISYTKPENCWAQLRRRILTTH